MCKKAKNILINKVRSLYIHFPFCRQKCNYCDFHSNEELSIDHFHQYLLSSINTHCKYLADNNLKLDELETLYIGGGTPSLWGKLGPEFIKNNIFVGEVRPAKNVEFTVEMNPDSINEIIVECWKSIGVNRLSIGIQSLNDNFLGALNRVHSKQEALDSLAIACEKVSNISVDFMLGLPELNGHKRDIINELEEVLQFSPKHISIYILTVQDHYIHHKNMPDDESIEREYLKVSEFLREKGYLHYEVSNFAIPGHESKHNLNYWQSKSVCALGPSATGFLQEKQLRYKWRNDKPVFDTEKLNDKELRLEKFYMRFRTNLGVISKEFFQDEALEKFKSIEVAWKKLGFADVTGEVTKLSPRGYLMLDSLMDNLFREELL